MDVGLLAIVVIWIPFFMIKLGVRWSFKVWAWIYGVFFLLMFVGHTFFSTTVTVKIEKLLPGPTQVGLAFDRSGGGGSPQIYQGAIYMDSGKNLSTITHVTKTRSAFQYGLLEKGITLFWFGAVKIDATIDGPGGSCHKAFVSIDPEGISPQTGVLDMEPLFIPCYQPFYKRWFGD